MSLCLVENINRPSGFYESPLRIMLRDTPAMMAGLTDHLWTIKELVENVMGLEQNRAAAERYSKLSQRLFGNGELKVVQFELGHHPSVCRRIPTAGYKAAAPTKARAVLRVYDLSKIGFAAQKETACFMKALLLLNGSRRCL